MHSHRNLCVILFCAFVALAPTSQAAQPGPPAKLSMIAGNGQVVQENFPANVPMTIRVTDASNVPVAGVNVTWGISCAPEDYGCNSQFTGTLMQSSSQTDSMGIATTGYNQTYVPSGLSFTQATITATTPIGSAQFKVTASNAFSSNEPAVSAYLAKPGPNGVISGATGATLPGAVQLSVSPFVGFNVGQGIPNVGVRIIDVGTMSASTVASCNAPGGTVLTDASGNATCDLMLSNKPGSYRLAAEVGGGQADPEFELTITSGATCTYSISPTSASVPAQGGNGLINVTADPGCTWTVITDPTSFISIVPGSSGVGNGVVAYTVGTNPGLPRSGTITIAGQSFIVNQGGTAAGPLTITSVSNLLGATQGVGYSAILTATGGTGIYTWTVTSGSLPPGLGLSTVNSTGVISGIPGAAGTFPFTVTVSDTGGATQSVGLSIAVGASGGGISILTTSVPNGTVGVAYVAPLTFTPPSVSCGSPFGLPQFAVSAGALPPGLSLQGNSIAGTPTTPGTYPFSLVVANSSCQSPPVAFTITINGVATPTLLNANPSGLVFNASVSGGAAAQQVTITSTGASVSLSTAVNVTWLSAALNSTTTPAILTVGLVNLASIPPGTYGGQITITAPGNNVLVIPVTLVLAGGPPPIGITVSANSVTFSLPSNSYSQQVITVLGSSGNPSVAFLATAATATGTPWLGLVLTAGATPVTAISATTPANLGITVNTANLPPGRYTGTVMIQQQGTGQSVTIPVTMTVAQPTVTADTQSLAFTFIPGTAAPAPQTINLFSNNPVPVTVTAVTAAGANWLFTTAAGGTAPTSITVSVNPAGLTRGTYNGTVIIAPQDPSIPTIRIPVSLTIGVGAGPVINGVVNAASNAPGPVSAGEFVAIYGNALSSGPGTLTLNSNGTISNTLNSTQVLFDGIPAALVYVSATQINAIVPYEIYGRARTQVQVQYNGALSSPVDLAVSASAPGIFLCLTCQPANQAAALNQDNTPNGVGNGALPNSVVTLFATGEGQTNPAGVTGTIVGTTLAQPLLPVTVRIGGLPAVVTYAGSAPSLAEGVLQVNVQIPAGVPRGVSLPVTITIGDATSNTGTIAIAP